MSVPCWYSYSEVRRLGVKGIGLGELERVKMHCVTGGATVQYDHEWNSGTNLEWTVCCGEAVFRRGRNI